MNHLFMPVMVLVLAILAGFAFSQKESYQESVGSAFGDDVADRMMQLVPVRFSTTASEGGQIYGFNTSDAQGKMPEVVYSDGKGLQKTNYGDMIPIVVKQLQRIDRTIADLRRTMMESDNKTQMYINYLYSRL